MKPDPKLYIVILLFIVHLLAGCISRAQSQLPKLADTPDPGMATPQPVSSEEIAMITSVANTTATAAAATIEAILRATSTTTPDLAATQTSEANRLETAVVATLTEQSTALDVIQTPR